MDDPEVDDFEQGEVDLFKDKLIGNCDEFQCHQQPTVTLIHEGTDGWKPEYVRLVWHTVSSTKQDFIRKVPDLHTQ